MGDRRRRPHGRPAARLAIICPSSTTTSATADPGRQLRNGATGLCLAVGKSEVKKGKWPIQWTCETIADQAWYMQRQ